MSDRRNNLSNCPQSWVHVSVLTNDVARTPVLGNGSIGRTPVVVYSLPTRYNDRLEIAH